MSEAAEVFEQLDNPIGGVMPEHLAAVLPRVQPLLEKVVWPHTGHTIESALRDIALGYTQLWVVGDFHSIFVTRIVPRPNDTVLWVEWMAGEKLKSWVGDMFSVCRAFAEAHACSAIEFNGPAGVWERYEDEYPEFKNIAKVYRCEL